jgi:hypothetical protein
MGYESNTGLGVNNHYGERPAGGTEGEVKTEGSTFEFHKELDETGLAFGFPIVDGSAYVTESDVSQVDGTVTVETIGGVDVSGATPEAPVLIPAANTGVIVLTGGTGGQYLVKYKKYPMKA